MQPHGRQAAEKQRKWGFREDWRKPRVSEKATQASRKMTEKRETKWYIIWKNKKAAGQHIGNSPTGWVPEAGVWEGTLYHLIKGIIIPLLPLAWILVYQPSWGVVSWQGDWQAQLDQFLREEIKVCNVSNSGADQNFMSLARARFVDSILLTGRQ